MKKTILAMASLAAFTVHAQATDVSSNYGDWTGASISAIGGYGWGESNASPAGVMVSENPDTSADLKGWNAGASIGYDVQSSSGLVIGAVTDFIIPSLMGDACIEESGCELDGPDDTGADNSYSETDVDWISTVRLRAGMPMGDALIYATGGLAFAKVTAGITNFDDENSPTLSESNTHLGYAVGAGFEQRLSDNMTVGIEYLYVNLGEERYDFSSEVGDLDDLYLPEGVIGADGDLSANLIRAKISFRF